MEQLTEQVNLLVITRGAGNGNLYYTAYMTAELKKWGAVVKLADIKAE